MLSKSSKWELGLVHYTSIVKFTISRFIISRLECILPTKTDTPMVWYRKYIAKPTWRGHDQIRFTIKHASIIFWVSTLIKLTISPARKGNQILLFSWNIWCHSKSYFVLLSNSTEAIMHNKSRIKISLNFFRALG